MLKVFAHVAPPSYWVEVRGLQSQMHQHVSFDGDGKQQHWWLRVKEFFVQEGKNHQEFYNDLAELSGSSCWHGPNIL